MNIIIANSSQSPIYEQIMQQVKHQIISGEIGEGEALPSIRKLAHDLQISVITTKRAYDELEHEGYINTVMGRGTFVSRQSQAFLREKKIRLVEEKLAEAVDTARQMNIEREKLIEMLNVLYEEA